MSSTKLFSQRAVNYLLGSLLRDGDTSKCQICTALKHRQQDQRQRIIRSFSATTSHKQNQHSPDATTLSTDAETSHLLGRHTKSTNQRHICRTNQPVGRHDKKFIRLTSTTSAATAAATTTTNLKREASTQAQQQQVDALDHLHHDHLHQARIEPYFDSFRSSELQIIQCKPGELSPKPCIDKLVFGHAFTDHMFRVDWDHEHGWSTPLISKVHNLDLHPGAKVLHYALEAFEGAKAYRGHDNKIRFFRLDQNVKRLLHSTRRLSLPEFDQFELIKCIHKLVQLDQDWIPKSHSPHQLTSLYIRPTVMGIEPSLGVARSKKAILYVLLSPAGPYFKTGFKPISLYADPNFVRAWPGGAGNTKLGSNYAPTIMVQKQAEKLGLQQVLWLFGEDMKLTEVGTMNVFVSIRHPETGKIHLVTPPLTDGLILPGITRNSILELARQWSDVICEERYVTIGELRQLIHEGRLVEMFGAGTACIVCPISSIQMKDRTILRIPFTDITEINSHDDGQGPFLTKRILKAITDIQYGRVQHPWAEELMFG